MSDNPWTQELVDRHNASVSLTGRGQKKEWGVPVGSPLAIGAGQTGRTLTVMCSTDDAPAPEKRGKYRNKKTWQDGILFASGHEADRYLQLKALQELGQIRDLELQPKF